MGLRDRLMRFSCFYSLFIPQYVYGTHSGYDCIYWTCTQIGRNAQAWLAGSTVPAIFSHVLSKGFRMNLLIHWWDINLISRRLCVYFQSKDIWILKYCNNQILLVEFRSKIISLSKQIFKILGSYRYSHLNQFPNCKTNR